MKAWNWVRKPVNLLAFMRLTLARLATGDVQHGAPEMERAARVDFHINCGVLHLHPQDVGA